jgi:hypothetical protein
MSNDQSGRLQGYELKHSVNVISALEQRVQVQCRKERIEYATLGLLHVTGIFVIGAIAPNVAGLLARILPAQRPANQRQSVKRTIARLIKQEYIQKADGKYHLTSTGLERLAQLETRAHLRSLGKSATPKWDKKWRIVMFDIHEARHHVRTELRAVLQEAGFAMLQKSVWVYPYRCDETIALLKFHLRLGYDLVYMIADALEGDESLRSHFNLPLEKK